MIRIETIEKAKLAVAAAANKKATDIVCLDIKDISSIADYFIICSGSSTTQVSAIANEIENRLRKIGIKNYHKEGANGQYWILLDFGDLVIHIFHQETREFYDLERLWGDAPRVTVNER